MNRKILQKPPRKYDMRYNTILTPEQEKIYQQWVNSLPINLRGDYDYDLRGAWLNGDQPNEYYHMPDTWKKPWHPTFSNESIYSTPGAEGGRWDGEEFHPSRLNRTLQSFKFGEWGDNTFAKGGPKKKVPTAEQLAAMANAQRDAEFSGMSPMSSTYSGPTITPASTTNKAVPRSQTQDGVKTQQIVQTTQNPTQTTSANVPEIKPAQLPHMYQSYYTNPLQEGWNNEAANLGYALGAGHHMTVDEVNNWTLNTANMAGWMAAPEVMGIFEPMYYAATKKPVEAAVSFAAGRTRPVYNAIKNIKANVAFNRSGIPGEIIKDVQNAVNEDAQRYVQRMLGDGNLGLRREFAEIIQPEVTYSPGIRDWFKYSSPSHWLTSSAVNIPGEERIIMNPLSLRKNPEAYKGIVAHEARHSFKYPGMPDVAVPTEKYYGPNRNFPFYDQIRPFEKAAAKGKWRGNPDELLSEMANWKYQKGVLNVPYYQLDKQLKEKLIKDASSRFHINELQMSNTLDGLSRYGYFNAGGSIHIKPENRGKFTAAAKRVGKSVQEYARQILAHKENYSTTLIKRANFARNFGGKK